MKIILTGGGTLGSVSPEIGIFQALKTVDDKIDALFIGTFSGPEKNFINSYRLAFKPICAGKLRRYFSLNNFLDPFLILLGCIQSFFIILKFKPQVIVSTGSFVAIPVILVGKILGIKVLIHQLDLAPTLSNQLVKYSADRITVTFKKSLADFPQNKTLLVGSVLRQEIKRNFPANQEKNILILGGGTGALALNQLIAEIMPRLSPEIAIHHVTGKNKAPALNGYANYYQYDLLKNDYYAKISQASLVISRAGLSTMLELAYLKKPTIIIPLPKSPQEENAEYFEKSGAVAYLKQKDLTAEKLAGLINDLLNDIGKLKTLSQRINLMAESSGAEKIAQEIIKLAV